LLDRHGCQRRVSSLLGRPVELTESELAGCGPKAVVARMLRNLKSIYLDTHDHLSALPVQRRLAALRLGDPDEQRDLGMLCLHTDRIAEAIDPLQAYLKARPAAPDSEAVGRLVKAARREVALWN
jgi:regulator of sirC expression with transglutaminase-like and TPR domain